MKLIKPGFFESDLYITDRLLRMDLKRIRESQRMTQKQISEICGLSLNCISSIENADDTIQSPTLRSMNKYLEALGFEMCFKRKDGR